MSRASAFGTLLAASILTLSLAPAASAASGAAIGSVGSTPTKVDREAYQSGVAAHAANMDAAEQVFTQSANDLRALAKDIEPLIGQQDSLSQESLQGYLATVTNHVTSYKTVSTIQRKLFNKACTRFTNEFARDFKAPKPRDKFLANVEAMRDAYNDFFGTNYQTLIDAGTALVNQDVPGFWKAIAIAEGGVAFTVNRFEKANRALRKME